MGRGKDCAKLVEPMVEPKVGKSPSLGLILSHLSSHDKNRHGMQMEG